ncbi:ribosome biogenesis GTPase YlqF [Candidatus Stoquefichus massiliensis]|uniref:ribosome biogenesis GTPase YlqF n=1 Tax=Candidatus Stoquefichus massiliensis TaxID=1470350 RepID=UPI000488BE94|nr:ribosome biogenesis GTPase YlqF [Candidatus Stoquefichus massiliensis]
MAQIQWFPGHMAKARREISERMKVIDIVIELVDARAPYSSKNPMINEIIKSKPRLIVLTKKDMANESMTAKWVHYYESLGYQAMSVNLKNFNEYQKIIEKCRTVLKPKMDKELSRGLKPRAIRAMVLGIPNVGKSTFINKLANRKATVTGNKPGVTKAQQIIRVDKDFELFDTPGVLWPKFDDEHVAKNIALLGSIKQSILPLDDLFIDAIKFITLHYPELLQQRYQLEIDLEDPDWVLDTFDHIAKLRKIKPLKGETDYDRVIELFFSEVNDGSIGRITWEDPSCIKE